ncbi:MAG: thiamine phosphate synthase [Acidobacteria bacterium]|nr:thiamine phosphate synthase [Acidobacteriota bacterium]
MLCLVTDRHRLAARRGRLGDPLVSLLEQVYAAGRAGVDLVHLRERDLPGRPLLELASACVRATEGTTTRVVVNDRADVAIAAGAAGVHLRGDSIDARRVRDLAPAGFLIGRSVRSADEARIEAGRGAVDYLVLGTMFPTESKVAGCALAGPDELARLTRRVTVPVIGIGGVTAATMPALAAAGAAGFAAIGWFIDVLDPAFSEQQVSERIAEARRLFDTSRSISYH